ncbi:MAG: hypothetical protein D6795_06475, partial [Deltaproteobacteria bacterium]
MRNGICGIVVLALCFTGLPQLGAHSRSVLDPGIRVDPDGDPVRNAREVLRKLGTAGIPLDDLRVDAVRRGKASHHVRFLQHYRGIPVWEGYLSVHYDRTGRVQLVENRGVPDLDLSVIPEISEDRAIEIARKAIGFRRGRGEIQTRLLVYALSARASLVWEVWIPALEPLGDWRVFVDAGNGKLRARWNELFFDSGYVYAPNPVQGTGNVDLRDDGNADSVALSAARVLVPLEGLTDNRLVGPYVDLCATGIYGAYKPACQAADPDGTRPFEFNFTRSDDRFEEVVVYHAVDQAQRYIQGILGFTDVNNRSIPAHAHYFSDQNAFYSRDDKGLHFGDGGVDAGEDADVVLHEYGHAIQEDQVPGWGPSWNTEQRAMGEGFGDFLAGMFYLDKGDPTYQNTEDHWAALSDWWATAIGYAPVRGTYALRWIDGTNEFTGDDIGAYPGTPYEEHDDGRYWSAALTCMYREMGREAILETVLESHFFLTPDSSNDAFEDGIDALLLADENLHGGVNRDTIVSCAVERNLIPCEAPENPRFTFPEGGEVFLSGEEIAIAWEPVSDTAAYAIDFHPSCAPFLEDDLESGTENWRISTDQGYDSWYLTTARSHSPTHAFFAEDLPYITDQYLDFGPFTVPEGAIARFHHSYYLETSYDGGVIEISVEGGPFYDLGDAIVENGYTHTISWDYRSPIAGRRAFSGYQPNFIETTIDLSRYSGRSVTLRFRLATDESVRAEGW